MMMVLLQEERDFQREKMLRERGWCCFNKKGMLKGDGDGAVLTKKGFLRERVMRGRKDEIGLYQSHLLI